MLQNISVSSSATGPYSVSFFQSAKLNENTTEAAHFIKDINAKDILGERSVELSQIDREERFYFCDICMNLFSHRNNTS
jgi:hypothetical protein